LQAEVDRLKVLQTETATELDALLPAILDRAVAEIPEGPEPFDALEWVLDGHLQFQQIHRELGWSKSPTLP
jgi:hypothetical protein